MEIDSRFFDRKAHLIDFKSFTEVMQNILDESTLEIEKDYPVLTMFSARHDCGYDEDDITERIGDYLGVNIIACLMYLDLGVIYFIEDE